MSFLNPVSEPVLRFKSTDTGAPQINYNARIAGDVKAVLKACLVTGYGGIASAGWTVANEVGNVCEFVSPSAAMSDYRLGVDDASLTGTTWYYQYQDVRTDTMTYPVPKNMQYIDAVNKDNGWQLLVTQRGFIFIELVYMTAAQSLSARITYVSQVKSGLTSETTNNLISFNIGHSASLSNPSYLYDPNYIKFKLNNLISAKICSASPSSLPGNEFHNVFDVTAMDLVSKLYLADPGRAYVIGELPALMSRNISKKSDLYGVSEYNLGGRPVLKVCCGFAHPNVTFIDGYARVFLIPLDYWEY